MLSNKFISIYKAMIREPKTLRFLIEETKTLRLQLYTNYVNYIEKFKNCESKQIETFYLTD